MCVCPNIGQFAKTPTYMYTVYIYIYHHVPNDKAYSFGASKCNHHLSSCIIALSHFPIISIF